MSAPTDLRLFPCTDEDQEMKDIDVMSSTGFPLSPMQAWLHYESAPTGRPWLHVIQAVVHLDAQAPSRDDVARAWAATAAAHPALRTSIRWRDAPRPEQTVAETVEVVVDEIDWQGNPPAKQHDELTAFLAADRGGGVEFETLPPWRVTLIRLAPDRAVMVVTSHNALTDAPSLAIVIEDFFAALDAGGTPVAPEPAATLRRNYDRIAEAPPAEAQAYFADYLSGYEPLGLSTSRSDADAALRPLIRAQTLDPATSAALVARATALGVAPQTLVEAAWGLVMMRWYNLADIVIGVTGQGRGVLPDAARAAGCFINTLPVRLQAGRHTTFGELVAGLARDAEAMRPFEQVSAAEIRRMGGVHGASYLFDSVLQYEDGTFDTQIRRSAANWSGRRAELLYEVDMPFSVSAYADDELKLELEFDPGVVRPEQGERMLAHLAGLLRAMAAAGADTPVHALDMMDAAERAELLAVGAPEAGLPAPFGLIERFTEVVARDPDAVAVQAATQPGSLTYAALDARSTALAAVLQRGGAAPGEIVAINLGRSLDYFVALLAVLKTGAAFVPVDPSYPDAVKAHMVTDSRARLIVADDDALATAGATIVRPDADPGEAAYAPVARDPEGLAYVIYTSGSTGVPKGVMIPDRALAAHNAAIIRYLKLEPADRVFQFISLSFDFSLEEIMPTLLTGATLILRSDLAAGSAPDFMHEIRDVQPTVVHLPTAYYHVVADYLLSSGERLPDGVRIMNVGGERLNPKLAKAWIAHQPGVRTLNGYGPTETTISCTFYEVTAALPEGDVPIGSATDHAFLYIAAPDGSLAPRGATGELWVGGPAVGLGYLGLKDKTDDVFLDDTFRGQGRVYRSGDRAAWRPDGDLNFFGRKDRQVKVRGFRIDLGHVERVLEKSQPDLRVLAAVRDAGTPAARLLAWAMLPEGGADAVDVEALKARARTALAPQMRPVIVAVDDFPRAAGGKIDAAALPEPGRTAQTGPADDEPMTDLERKVAELMSRTLGGTSVGAHDNFYDLGGHSLLAAELVGRIETELGARISVLDLQRDGSARGIATVVRQGSSGPRHISEIQPSGTRPPLFGIHILGHNDSFYTGLAAELGEDQPLLGVTIGAVTADQPTGVEATAQSYFEEIQEFYPEGPVNIVAVSLGAYFAWELVTLLREAGREIGHFGLFDADGPLGRAQVKGVRRLIANLRTIRHRGLKSIPVALYYRYHEIKQRRIAARMKDLQEEGGEITIRSGNDFIAMNDLAVEEYQPRPHDVPVTIYRSDENFFDTRASKNSGLGWANVALGGCEVIDVPGGHLTMLDYPHVPVLARHIARALDG